MNEPLTELRFWQQVMCDAERTVFCPPEYESRIKCWVDAQGMAGIIKVEVSKIVPENQIIVMDHNAIEASTRQAMQRDPIRMGPVPAVPLFGDHARLMRTNWRMFGTY